MDWPTLNPLDIDLILDQVLEIVGSKDLLSCRLVNKSWNEKSVEILKRRKCTIEVDESNIGQCLYFLELESQSHSTDKVPSPSLNFSLNITRDEMLSLSTKLIGLLFERNVESIKLDAVESFNEIDFWKVLRHTSAELENLHFHARLYNIFEDAGNPLVGHGLEEDGSINCQFPNLTSVHYDTSRIEDFPNSLVQIINSAPKLTKLSLISGLVSETGSGIPRILNGLTNLGTIRELEIAIRDQPTATALARLQFSQVQKLKIHQSIIYWCIGIFGRILQDNFPLLTSLDLYFHLERNYLEEPTNTVHPVLPNVTHFGYYMADVWEGQDNLHLARNVAGRIMENLIPASQMFPSLTSVGTNSAAFELLSSRVLNFCQVIPLRAMPPPREAVFPTVSRMTVAIPAVSKIDTNLSELGLTNRCTSRMYPRLREIVIDIELEGIFNVPTTVRNCQKKLIRSWLNIDGITTFEIRNYYHDWLTEILAENPEIGLKRQNLECLKLTYPKTKRLLTAMPATSQTECARFMKPKVCLKGLLEKIPKLGWLQVDNELLRNDGDITIEKVQERVDLLKMQFPMLKVELL